jgi:hypothetical protein
MIPPQMWHDGASSETPPGPAGSNASSGFVSNLTVWLGGGAFAGAGAGAPWPLPPSDGASSPIAWRSA